jgi:hypothetical protein
MTTIHSEGWQRSQAGQAAQQDELTSEFGVTLADAGRLLRKAKRVWIMFPVGPGGRNAIFGVPKSVVLKEIEFYQGGTKTFRPSELDHTTHDGPTLIFGSSEANERAAAAHQPGMAT